MLKHIKNPVKHSFIIFFRIYKNVKKTLLKKAKKGFKKRLVKPIKIVPNKKYTKSVNTAVNSMEIFLRKKERKSINMVSDTNIFQKMKNKS